ncbi:hypothetical protein HBI56_051360 [Parastagonospora nodorum]|nr:hypothetical protein HBH51_156950 [Parastagonospora nodorum]KAH4002987.1 hypothetical protein HBI10_064200 [Parastagonospora nodorum]KAH4022855.1 hypothetical protein HBI09_168670 [Parastagonospora nodorum]KAH4028331.1 hypothetical protein HBI13_053800 [Parastagonospora nodorum]KAH4209862.1 hypothetical protein HBI95_081800 [Parastagonospora nodorum]
MAARESLLGWSLPISPQDCAAVNHPIACNFQLYNNASSLTETQKLAPNNDITGKAASIPTPMLTYTELTLPQIMYAFLWSSITALVPSTLLIYDRFQWHFRSHSFSEKHKYLRSIHALQRLLHGISDHQLIAGLALLATLNNQACSISAYHYNIVCTMLILSAVTHLNSLLSIQDFIHKGRIVALVRVAAITAQYGLSAMVLSGRNAKTGRGFPMTAGSLGIMPAPCFLNLNASSYFGFGDAIDAAENFTATAFGSGNATMNATAMMDDTSDGLKMSPFWQYVLLVVVLGFALVFVIAEGTHAWYKDRQEGNKPPPPSKIISAIGIVLSAVGLFASAAVLILVYIQYENLRRGMEIFAWYQIHLAERQSWSYSEFMTVFLITSALLHGVKALSESLLGHKGRRFATEANKEYNRVGRMVPDDEQGEKYLDE